MNYIEKAALSPGKRNFNLAKITVVAVICVVGILLSVYSITVKNYLFAALYIIAAILGLMYVVIKVNTVMPTYIAVDDSNVYMQCWDNGVFAYKVNFKPAFLADFIPAKVQKKEIPIENIKSIHIGSKNYLVRNLEETVFPEEIEKATEHRKHDVEVMRKMDILCITDSDNNVNFMSVTDTDTAALARVINYIHRKNEEADIKCNLRDLRSRLTI